MTLDVLVFGLCVVLLLGGLAINAQLSNLQRLIQGKTIMTTDLSALEAAVKADTDATNAALTLIKGISAQLAAAQGDPAKISALVTQLNANADALSAAVLANTTPAPGAAPTPPAPAPDAPESEPNP